MLFQPNPQPPMGWIAIVLIQVCAIYFELGFPVFLILCMYLMLQNTEPRKSGLSPWSIFNKGQEKIAGTTTAADFENELYRKLLIVDLDIEFNQILEQAKQIEKEQIVEAFYEGVDQESDTHGAMNLDRKDAENYYNETFKTK